MKFNLKHILVVDDEPYYLAMLEDMININIDYQVYSAKDGVEADSVLESRKIDAVVTDVYMPEKDGLELLLQLREQDIPVIIVSGGGRFGDDYLEPAKKFGAYAILRKPFLQKDLLNALSSALET